MTSSQSRRERARPVRQGRRAGRAPMRLELVDTAALEDFSRRDPSAVRAVYRAVRRSRVLGRASRARLARISPKKPRNRRSCARGRPPIVSTRTATPVRGWRRSPSAPRSTSIVARRGARRTRWTTSPPTIPPSSRLPPDVDTLDSVWQVRRAIEALPPDEAAIVRLQHLDGITHTEIAAKLGIAVGTVKSRSHRAHTKLAALLGHLREPAS